MSSPPTYDQATIKSDPAPSDNVSMSDLDDFTMVEAPTTEHQPQPQSQPQSKIEEGASTSIHPHVRGYVKKIDNQMQKIRALKQRIVELEAQLEQSAKPAPPRKYYSTINHNVNTIEGDVDRVSGNVGTVYGNVTTICGNVEKMVGDVGKICGNVTHLHEMPKQERQEAKQGAGFKTEDDSGHGGPDIKCEEEEGVHGTADSEDSFNKPPSPPTTDTGKKPIKFSKDGNTFTISGANWGGRQVAQDQSVGSRRTESYSSTFDIVDGKLVKP